jgi:hypothetical protein
LSGKTAALSQPEGCGYFHAQAGLRRGSMACQMSERSENSLDLFCVTVQRAVGPDDKIGAGDFCFDGLPEPRRSQTCR